MLFSATFYFSHRVLVYTQINIKRWRFSLLRDGGMWVEMMWFIPMALNSPYLYFQPRLFSVLLTSIFKCLHEQLSWYFKFNFSEIKFFLPASPPNLLLLLPQPPTPNLFLLPTPLSKSMALLAILLKAVRHMVILDPIFSLRCHMQSMGSLLLYLKHIFNPSLLSPYFDHYLLINHHNTSPKLLQLLQAS